MKKPFRRGIFLLLVVVFAANCVTDPPVPQDYYAGLEKIKGGQPPPPVSLAYDSQTEEFSWTASIDPESGQEVPEYFFYYSFGGLPRNLLDPDYFQASVNRRRTVVINFARLSRGMHYFWVTAFDGGRESLPSNIISLYK